MSVMDVLRIKRAGVCVLWLTGCRCVVLQLKGCRQRARDEWLYSRRDVGVAKGVWCREIGVFSEDGHDVVLR